MRRALVLLALLAGAACARRPALLELEEAAIDFPADAPAGGPGRLTVTARVTGLRLDPTRTLRLDVGQSARWVRLEPMAGRAGVYAVAGEEYGYSLTLDPAAGRLSAVEPDVAPGRENPLLIGVAQDGRTACVRARFLSEGLHWTLDPAPHAQAPCAPR